MKQYTNNGTNNSVDMHAGLLCKMTSDVHVKSVYTAGCTSKADFSINIQRLKNPFYEAILTLTLLLLY